MLAILTTHLIQYQVPIWQELAKRNSIEFEVWYLSDLGSKQSKDAEFGREFQWDLDLLGGYPHQFLPTQPITADVSTFRGAQVGSLSPLFKEKNVTALWINGWQVRAYWQAAFQAHRCGVPVWLRGESNDLRRNPKLKEGIKKLALRRLFGRVSEFLYIGSSNKRFYQNYGVLEKRLHSAPYCVDNHRFMTSAAGLRARREELRKNWGIPSQATCFLFCGKFIPKKRPMDILDAAELLLERQPGSKDSLHIIMVGDGALRGELEGRAQKIEERWGRPIVTFVGFLNQQEIPTAYVVADCLVLPSDFGETWGLVVNEALACGTPSLVSDQCGSAEDLALPLGKDFVFPCGETQILSKKMALRIGQSTPPGLTVLAEKYAIERTVETVELLYRQNR